MHHTDIIGATRSGKTNFILSTLEGAFCFIDKHGDAARQIADSMECIYWRPADLTHCVAYNPLQNVPPDERWRVTAEIVSVFSDIWNLGPETPRLLLYLTDADPPPPVARNKLGFGTAISPLPASVRRNGASLAQDSTRIRDRSSCWHGKC